MRGLRHLGVPLRNQIYLGLPDGALHEPDVHLEKHVADVAKDVRPSRIFTTGATGYDGHSDHIAMHNATVHAGADMRFLGWHMEMWALANNGGGELLVYGDIGRKLGSIAMHSSQREEPDLLRWGGGNLYCPLIRGPETYSQSSLMLA